MRVLIVTVGGSDAPIVKSVEYNKPDLTIFMCTESRGQEKGSKDTILGAGLVCTEKTCSFCGQKKPDRASIPKQANLNNDAYAVVSVESDDPYDTYGKASRLIKDYLSEGHEVLVDYTGGTKSMSVGLALAGMENEGCTVSFIKGPRLDLVRVMDGMERVAMLPNKLYSFRQYRLFDELIKSRDYVAASKVLEDLGRHGHIEDEKQFERKTYLCRGFSAWDKFDYRNARQNISLYKELEDIAIYNKLIGKIVSTLDWHAKWKSDSNKNPPGFVLVYDVLLNAERRALQGNYDDGVSRLYRAVEMYAQFCLRTGNPRLRSDDLDISLLPTDCKDIFRSKTEQNQVQIGLKDSFELLSRLNSPLGVVWQCWRDKILNILSKRNYSFLAHGMVPLNKQDFQEMQQIIWPFILECDKALGFRDGLRSAVQLPQVIY